jgi:acyl dehydratase
MAAIHPRGLPVERGKIHEFAEAILDDHPHYHDQDAARAAGLPGVVAPPTFAMAAALFSGTADAPAEMADFDMRYALHGAQEFIFERPLVEGDVLVGEAGEARTYEKSGRRGGRMKFVEFETVYRDRSGAVVLRSRVTAIQTEGVLEGA